MVTWSYLLSPCAGIVANLRILVTMAATQDGAVDQPPIDPRLAPPSVEPSPKCRRRHARRPAPGSLYDLIRQHSGKSLFVRPLLWTNQHSDALGVHFQELPPCNTPLPQDLKGSPPPKGLILPSTPIRTLSHALTDILLPSSTHYALSTNAMKTVLATLWPDSLNMPSNLPQLHLFFGGRVYRDSVRIQLMWRFPGASPSSDTQRTASTCAVDSFASVPSETSAHDTASLPMMCYLSKTQLASMRKNMFRVPHGPGNNWNEPVWRLQQLRSKMLTPEDANRDPHLAAVFLAMAQRHFYGVPTRSYRRDHPWVPRDGHSSNPTFHDVKLRVMTHDTETAEFLIYTATVTAGFLQRFHDPFSAPRDNLDNVPGLDVQYTRVPVWPILGLRERIGKALGEEVVGPFDPNEMETWEDDDEGGDVSEKGRNIGLGGAKRKHDALNEVFNGSFESDTSNDTKDEPALSAKKRCLSEGAQVGVVI